jgi:GDP-D-mannose dehydratase
LAEQESPSSRVTRDLKGAWHVQVLKSLSCEIVGCGLPLTSSPSVYEQLNTFSAISNAKYGLPEFIDINDNSAIRTAFHKFQPDIVFHMAAQASGIRGISKSCADISNKMSWGQ